MWKQSESVDEKTCPICPQQQLNFMVPQQAARRAETIDLATIANLLTVMLPDTIEWVTFPPSSLPSPPPAGPGERF